MELNKYSKTLTQDITQPAAQAMLYGVGLTDEDLAKAQVCLSVTIDVGQHHGIAIWCLVISISID